jgi:hypothetical protein
VNGFVDRGAVLSLAVTAPHAGGCRLADERGVVARRTTERPLNAVAYRGIPAVKNLREEIADERDELGRYAGAFHRRLVVVDADLDEAEVTPGDACNLSYRLGEGPEPGSRELVHLAGMAILDQ